MSTTFAQNKQPIVIKYNNKHITMGTIFSKFNKEYPQNVKFMDQDQLLSIFKLAPEESDLKLYFYKDLMNDMILIGIVAQCFSDNCNFGESSYDVISKQLKIDDRFLHQVNDGKGTKTKYYHYPGYLVIDEQYVGLETGDPSFNISLIDLRYLDKWTDNVDYSALYTLSTMIMVFQEEFTDYQLITDFVERVAKNELKENSNVAQSVYHPFTSNPYTILANIYRIKGDYKNLLDIWQQIEKFLPNDTIVKSNITEYQNILSEDDVHEIEDIETMRMIANKFNGSWKGRYTCGQGETGLLLEIYAKTSGKIAAKFTCYPLKSNPDVKLGSFILEGDFTKNGGFVLSAKEWIRKSDNYEMVDMSGRININYSKLNGIILNPRCSKFELNKVHIR
jgi:hypothetical protein